ncbi:MAG: hypothetical protein C4344_01820 [Acidimicrobiia bacterium]
MPFRSAVDLAYRTEWYAPPGIRAVPTVSNCRSDRTLEGNPPLPLVGLPNCVYPAEEVGAPRPSWPFDPGVTVRALREAGIPVPDNVGFPSLTGLEEAPAVPLQALRLGTVAVTFCPCEQFADQALNIKHRLERVIDALPAPPTGWDWRSGQTPWGFDWARAKTPGGRDFCIPQGAGATRTWRCADPRDPSRDLPAISDVVYRRMRAHVLNDASGWDDPSRSLESESEPPDPDEIRGNFTHERLVGRGRFVGYDLVSTVSMANDYWGYIVTYREFQRGDHYRKALTGLGPHAADFLATRLARIAAGLSDPEIKPPRTPKDDTYAVAGPAYARNLARAAGALAAATVPAREASLPRDGGTPRIVRQPDDVERFSAASMTWIGGSNSFDVPDVVIERQVGNRFVPVADTNADVQIRVVFPTPAELASWRTGSFEWRWTATFETYASDVALPDLLGKWHNATPVGVYRMVVVGRRHLGAGRTEPYRLVSRPFRVLPWRGISVEAIRADADGVTVDPGPTHQVRYGVPSDPYLVGPIDYPDTYASPFRFIRGVRTLVTYGLASPERHQQFCFTCSFEPWVDAGSPQRILVTVLRRSGTREVVEAHRRGEGPLAVWFAAVALEPGDKAFVDAGAIVDAFGNTNAHPSRTVERT